MENQEALKFVLSLDVREIHDSHRGDGSRLNFKSHQFVYEAVNEITKLVEGDYL